MGVGSGECFVGVLRVGDGGWYKYSISLEVSRQISHIPLNQQANIPTIDFPKYPISPSINKNIAEFKLPP